MAQSRSSVFTRLEPVFRDVFDNDDLAPHESMTAEEVDEWDSLSHIRLIVAIEQAFGIRFSTAELSDLQNVGQMVDLIIEKS